MWSWFWEGRRSPEQGEEIPNPSRGIRSPWRAQGIPAAPNPQQPWDTGTLCPGTLCPGTLCPGTLCPAVCHKYQPRDEPGGSSQPKTIP